MACLGLFSCIYIFNDCDFVCFDDLTSIGIISLSPCVIKSISDVLPARPQKNNGEILAAFNS
jgi:hypothetical protein